MRKLDKQKRYLRQSKLRVNGMRRGKAKIAGHRLDSQSKVERRRFNRHMRG